MSIIADAIERSNQIPGVSYSEDMKLVPDDFNGLGYEWYPVIIECNDENKLGSCLEPLNNSCHM